MATECQNRQKHRFLGRPNCIRCGDINPRWDKKRLNQARAELGEFYSWREAEAWLNTPHKLLGGQRPIDVLGTEDAQKVFDLIDQLRRGAYA